MLLEGIRILDFGRYLAGPFCAALLADMGAEVIRIEKVDGGDDRYVAPVVPDGSGALFMTANRNKRGMTLNPLKDEGKVIAKKLIATADVVVANLPPPALKLLGLDYESLKAVRKDIILVLITAFGSEGPQSYKTGFDTVAQALSGAMHLSGFDGKPTRSVVLFEDYGTAMLSAFGTVCALWEREKSGQGQIVETSLMKTGLNYMNALMMAQMMSGNSLKQQGNRSLWAAPADTYKTADGWIVVSVLGKGGFKRWCELVKRLDLFEHPELQNDASRAEHAELLDEVMLPWCGKRTTERALSELENAKISCAPVLTLEQAVKNTQSFLQPQPYAEISKAIPYVEPPLTLSRTPGSIRNAAPELGADTESILKELGYNDNKIRHLLEDRII